MGTAGPKSKVTPFSVASRSAVRPSIYKTGPRSGLLRAGFDGTLAYVAGVGSREPTAFRPKRAPGEFNDPYLISRALRIDSKSVTYHIAWEDAANGKHERC